MSIALYRKYRPKEFSEIVGQKYIVKAITNAIENNRLSHAYLFTGPRGVGKTSMARLLAQSINGDTEQNIEEIRQGRHVDVVEIDAASNRGVDEIRNLKEKIQYVPLKGKMKIYIIDEVHMLTNEAFNALLKTLEEPPSHALFILATTEVEKLPLTVISRCQRYDFTPITEDELIELFTKVSSIENIDIDKESISLIYDKSEGSVRDAFSIYETIIDSLSNEKITKDKTEKILGFIPSSYFEEFTDILEKNHLDKVIEYTDKLWRQGINIEKFLKGYAKYLKVYNDKYLDYIYIIYTNLFKFRYEEDKRMVIYLIIKEIINNDQKNIVKLKKTEKITVTKKEEKLDKKELKDTLLRYLKNNGELILYHMLQNNVNYTIDESSIKFSSKGNQNPINVIKTRQRELKEILLKLFHREYDIYFEDVEVVIKDKDVINLLSLLDGSIR